MPSTEHEQVVAMAGGVIHVWQMFPDLPEAEDAVGRIGAFIERHCSG